jgi:hypothetical protein
MGCSWTRVGRAFSARRSTLRSLDDSSRCTDVVGWGHLPLAGDFPNPPALLRPAGAVLLETHDEWQVSDRRYLSEGSSALLTRPDEEVAQAALIASWSNPQNLPAAASYTTGGTSPSMAWRARAISASRSSAGCQRRIAGDPSAASPAVRRGAAPGRGGRCGAGSCSCRWRGRCGKLRCGCGAGSSGWCRDGRVTGGRDPSVRMPRGLGSRSWGCSC